MEQWKGNGMKQLVCKVAAKSCNRHCSIEIELPSVSLVPLSHQRYQCFMSKYIATTLSTVMLPYSSMVLSLAHHQML